MVIPAPSIREDFSVVGMYNEDIINMNGLLQFAGFWIPIGWWPLLHHVSFYATIWTKKDKSRDLSLVIKWPRTSRVVCCFYIANLNCPVITANDTRLLLWQSKNRLLVVGKLLATLTSCHSIPFPDGVLFGLMAEQIAASVLSSIYWYIVHFESYWASNLSWPPAF